MQYLCNINMHKSQLRRTGASAICVKLTGFRPWDDHVRSTSHGSAAGHHKNLLLPRAHVAVLPNLGRWMILKGTSEVTSVTRRFLVVVQEIASYRLFIENTITNWMIWMEYDGIYSDDISLSLCLVMSCAHVFVMQKHPNSQRRHHL